LEEEKKVERGLEWEMREGVGRGCAQVGGGAAGMIFSKLNM
jgi:hypothetical protein